MQSRIICKILFSRNFITYCVSALLTVFSAVVLAEGDMYQAPSIEHVQHNPWALPQQPERQPNSQVTGQYYADEHGQADSVPSTGERFWDGRGQKGRFITREKLESLKQQSRKYQSMTEKQPSSPYGRRPYDYPQSGSGMPGEYYPAYGAGIMNPLFDAPVVSPWGSGVDVLNRGTEFPLVPSEAIGGIPPMYLPPVDLGQNKQSESGESSDGNKAQEEYKVFNPFTFLPDSGVQKP